MPQTSLFSVTRPTADDLRLRRDQLRNEPLTYSSQDGQVPPGFTLNYFEVELGRGAAAFHAATKAIDQWRMFPRQMAKLDPEQTPIAVGEIVCVLFRAGPLWTVNPCRILRVMNDSNDAADVLRYGFVYGTLLGHVARGEERFLVEWNRNTDAVTYSIQAFSRPAHWLMWLGYPYLTMQQQKFRRLSGAAMQTAVREQVARTPCP